MADLPDDAIHAVLAAVVPCPESSRMQTAEKKPWCVAWPEVKNGRCDGCLGDGTRVVITNVEVAWHETIRAWREVPS